MHKRFGVVGACCVDLFATSAHPLIAHDSNPGSVQFGYGGVGRNIAENLAKLNQSVHLFAAFGSDPFSLQMLSHTQNTGVDTSGCLRSSTAPSPYYIAVNDSAGDLSVAVNDMAICEQITPAFLSGSLALLNTCDAVILDTNIPKETIEYLAQHCTSPLYADSVSVTKALKLSASLPRLFALNTNRREAQALLHTEISAELDSLKEAANRFHALGVHYVLITLGAKGAFLSDGDHQIMAGAFPTETVNANGCGDAFSASAFLSILSGHSPEEILKHALAAAAITAQSAQSVSSHISPMAIREILNRSEELK